MFIILSGAVADAAPVRKAASSCETSFVRLSAAETAQVISQKLSALPGLKPYIEKMINDPNIPANLRRMVQSTLSRPDVSVVQLNDSLMNNYLIHRDMAAFHTNTSFAPDIKLQNRKNEELSFNAEASRLAGGNNSTKASIASTPQAGVGLDLRRPYPYPKGHGVFVRDRALSADTNDLLSFVHELAHVKFDVFLKKNILMLRKNFPMYVRRSLKGGYKVDEQFYHYLTERYAHETEWATLKATHGSYFVEWNLRWGYSPDTPDAVIRQNISDQVAANYGITDPVLLALRGRSLTDILANGIKKP